MTDKLISQKAVLDHLNDICNRCGRFNRNNGAECSYCELCGMDEFVEELPTISQADSSVIAKIKRWSESPEYSYGERNVMKVILQELEDTIPQINSVLEKQSLRDYLTDLRYEIYHELCKEIHQDEECPCTNQTTSCLAKFRVCDANSAIGRIIDKRIKNGRVPCGITCAEY